jgi:hypothetical protein
MLRQMAAGQGEPSPLLPYLRFAMAAVVGALIIWFLARAVFRRPDEGDVDDVDEVRDFVWSWAAFRDAVRRWLRGLGRRPGRRAPAPAGPAAAPPADRARWGPREIYAALLRLGARLGRRRASPETPHEYERALASLTALAPGARAIDTVTELFVQDRYGAEGPSAAAIGAGRAALDELEGLAAASESEAGRPAPDR